MTDSEIVHVCITKDYMIDGGQSLPKSICEKISALAEYLKNAQINLVDSVRVDDKFWCEYDGGAWNLNELTPQELIDSFYDHFMLKIPGPIYAHRLTEENLPAKCEIQVGTYKSDQFDWGESMMVTLYWTSFSTGSGISFSPAPNSPVYEHWDSFERAYLVAGGPCFRVVGIPEKCVDPEDDPSPNSKLIPENPEPEEPAIQEDMTEFTMNAEQIGNMLVSLALEIANQLNRKPQVITEIMDHYFTDEYGVDPGACEILEEVKQMAEEGESDEPEPLTVFTVVEKYEDEVEVLGTFFTRKDAVDHIIRHVENCVGSGFCESADFEKSNKWDELDHHEITIHEQVVGEKAGETGEEAADAEDAGEADAEDAGEADAEDAGEEAAEDAEDVEEDDETADAEDDEEAAEDDEEAEEAEDDEGEEAEDAEDDEEAEETCIFEFTKGPRVGQRCTTKPTHGEYCAKHKDCKVAKGTATVCMYIPSSGPSKDKQCTIKPKDGEHFCAKHKSTQYAIKYMAGELPIAKKSSKVETVEKTKPKIVRNKELKLWVVEETNLVVKSPTTPTVYTFITKAGKPAQKLNAAAKTLAKELGLKTE